MKPSPEFLSNMGLPMQMLDPYGLSLMRREVRRVWCYAGSFLPEYLWQMGMQWPV